MTSHANGATTHSHHGQHGEVEQDAAQQLPPAAPGAAARGGVGAQRAGAHSAVSLGEIMRT